MNAKNEQLRAAIYLKVSTNEQADTGISLEVQRRRCEAYAAAKDWTVSDVYEDAGASAGSLRRDALTRLRDPCGRREIDVVCFLRIDRLTRSTRDL